jgi:hypothetical protein
LKGLDFQRRRGAASTFSPDFFHSHVIHHT